MAPPRSQRLARLVSVQRKLEQLAELDLSETNRQRDRVAEDIQRTTEALQSMDPVHRAFAARYGVRIGTLSLREQQLSGLARVQERRVLTERTKADRLADDMGEALDDERREGEDASLADLLDLLLATPAQASRKIGRR